MADPTLDPLSSFHQVMSSRANDALTAQLQAMQLRATNMGALQLPDLSGPVRGMFAGLGVPTTFTQLGFQTAMTSVQYDAALRQMRGLTGGRFGVGAEALGGFAVRGSAFGDEAAATDRFAESLKRLGMSRFDALNTMQALAMSARQVTKDMGDAVVKISELSKVAGIDAGTGATLVGTAMRTTGAPVNAQNGQAFFSMMMANAGYNTANLFASQSAVRGMADMMTMRGAPNRLLDPSTGMTAADALYRQFVQFNPQLYGPGGDPAAALRQVGLMAAGGKGAFLGIAMDLMPNKSISQVFAALDRGQLTFPLRNAIARDPALRDLAALSGLDANFIEGYGSGAGRRSADDTRRRVMLIAQTSYQGSLAQDLGSSDREVRRRAQRHLDRVNRDEFLVSTMSDPYEEQAANFYTARTGRSDFSAALANEDSNDPNARIARASYNRAVNEKKRRATDPSSLDLQDATSEAIQLQKDTERTLETSAPFAAQNLAKFLRKVASPFAGLFPTGTPGPDEGSWNPFSDKPFRLNPFPGYNQGPIDALFPGDVTDPAGGSSPSSGSADSSTAVTPSGGSPSDSTAVTPSGGSPSDSTATTPSGGPPSDSTAAFDPLMAFRETGKVVMAGQAVMGARNAKAALRVAAFGESVVARSALPGIGEAAANATARRTERFLVERGAKKLTTRLLWSAARERLGLRGALWLGTKAFAAGAVGAGSGGSLSWLSALMMGADIATVYLLIDDARKAANEATGQSQPEEGSDPGSGEGATEQPTGAAPADSGQTSAARPVSSARPASPVRFRSMAEALAAGNGFMPDSHRIAEYQAATSRSMRQVAPSSSAQAYASGRSGVISSTPVSGGGDGSGVPSLGSLSASMDRLASAANDLVARVDRGDIKVVLDETSASPSLFGFGRNPRGPA